MFHVFTPGDNKIANCSSGELLCNAAIDIGSKTILDLPVCCYRESAKFLNIIIVNVRKIYPQHQHSDQTVQNSYGPQEWRIHATYRSQYPGDSDTNWVHVLTQQRSDNHCWRDRKRNLPVRG